MMKNLTNIPSPHSFDVIQDKRKCVRCAYSGPCCTRFDLQIIDHVDEITGAAKAVEN